MPKPSHREKLLAEGLRVVHEHGFAGASVRDIVKAAGVPQGSFTNHFPSKEAFGLEILNLYFARSVVLMGETLRNDTLPPLQRLRDYIGINKQRLCQSNMRAGCLYGNFSAEMAEDSEIIRERLVEIFAEVRSSIAYCLKAAAQAGEVRKDLPCEEIAALFVSSLQGAILVAKAERSVEPVERFEKFLFSTLLK